MTSPATLGSILASDQLPTRIHIVGTTGSGKSTLARRLGVALGLPVHDLDSVARRGGGRGPLRSDTERRAAIATIVGQPGWITEGVHIGWTEPLFEHAQLVIWLDHLPTSVARRRVVVRFLRSAATEARRRQGRERFLRFRDYLSQLGGLIGHLARMKTDNHGAPGSDAPETRAAVARALEPHMDRVVRCERHADVQAVVDRIAGLGVGSTG